MKITAQVYIFCGLMMCGFLNCQTHKPNQDSSQNILEVNREEKTASVEGNISKTINQVFENCPGSIHVKKGEIFQIKLSAISGTGYTWMFSITPKLLTMKNAGELRYDESEPPVNTNPETGRKKRQILEMTAVESGKETIELVYKRTWEKSETNTDKCSIEVTVEN